MGMMREFVVVDREDENGQMVLSLAVLEVRGRTGTQHGHPGWGPPEATRVSGLAELGGPGHMAHCRCERQCMWRAGDLTWCRAATPPPPRLLGAQASIQWLRMQQMQQEEVTVRVRVESANRGGLLVRYGPFDGFVPVGQFGPVSGS